MPTTLYHNFLWPFTDERQSMLVEGGRVVVRGAEVASAAPVRTDMAGRYLFPSFVDSHCHVLPTGMDLQRLNLDGCSSKEEVLELVRKRHHEVDHDEWLMAVHYDQTLFENGEHLNRDQLDSISDTRPILLRHVNGHASVVNSAWLQQANITERAIDPKGGTFVRDSSGRLTGVLLERAHEIVSSAAKAPTVEQMVDAILKAGEKMATLGISCATDMMTGRFGLESELQAYRTAAERGCKVRLRLYMQWDEVFGRRAIAPERLRELSESMPAQRCSITGVKIFADGAIGSATAAIYGQFEGSSSDGQLIYSPDRLKEMVRIAHDAGYRIAIHSIGDRSTDLVMDAYEALDDPSRHRIEHAMILSDHQIERMEGLGVICSMQPEFLMRFGHSYRRQLGPERAAKLNRFRSVLDAGIPLCFNSDRPITGGDPWHGILTAVQRPEGFDPSENINLEAAFHAYTAAGAAANGDAKEIGSLEPGQWADFQTVDAFPSN